MNWLYLPFAMLVVFAAYLGYRLGQVPTETEVINAAAADYLRAEAARGRDAQATDCRAVPGADGQTRLVVYCQPAHLAAGQAYEYLVDRWGRMNRLTPQ